MKFFRHKEQDLILRSREEKEKSYKYYQLRTKDLEEGYCRHCRVVVVGSSPRPKWIWDLWSYPQKG